MTGHYRITSPTIAVFQHDGKSISTTVPAGCIVTVERMTTEDRLVDVVWNGRNVMMFSQDLRNRALQIGAIV